jgi:hypothetical protein
VIVPWDDGAIANTWLQVTVKATAATGLAAPDVFYFGNSIGETGNSTFDLAVNYIDALGAVDNASDGPVAIFNRFDFNRDGLVNPADVAVGRSRFRDGVAPLRMLSLVDGQVSFADHVPGDANGDGRFDSEDLVAVFQAGEYEDDIPGNSTFAEGDWNGDGDFTSRDFVAAFQYGAYDDGIANVPLAVIPAKNALPNGVFDLFAIRPRPIDGFAVIDKAIEEAKLRAIGERNKVPPQVGRQPIRQLELPGGRAVFENADDDWQFVDDEDAIDGLFL